MKKLIVTLALVAGSAVAWALPSVQEVEAQVQQGHYDKAEAMMGEVVAAKPGNARAHYVYAEVLAHEGKFAKAADEARLARQIDPDVKFTTAEKFRAFESKLQQAQSPAPRARVAPSTTGSVDSRPATNAVAPAAPAATAPVSSGGVPGWAWGAGLAAIAFLLWRGFSRSNAAVGPNGAVGAPAAYGANAMASTMGAPGATAYGAGSAPYGAGPGYAPARPSSGMLGVGLAAAGGVAAGMLAEQYLHRRPDQLADSSGAQPGFFDSPQGGSAASDLESRPVDFGTGGSDWDSGSSDAGGGGSSDSGGGWD